MLAAKPILVGLIGTLESELRVLRRRRKIEEILVRYRGEFKKELAAYREFEAMSNQTRPGLRELFYDIRDAMALKDYLTQLSLLGANACVIFAVAGFVDEDSARHFFGGIYDVIPSSILNPGAKGFYIASLFLQLDYYFKMLTKLE